MKGKTLETYNTHLVWCLDFNNDEAWWGENGIHKLVEQIHARGDPLQQCKRYLLFLIGNI